MERLIKLLWRKVYSKLPFRALRLKTKFFVYASILLVTLTITIAVFVEVHFNMIISAQAHKRGRSIARHLAATTVQPLLYYDYLSLQQKAEKALIEDDISFVAITDKENILAAFATRYKNHPRTVETLPFIDSLEVRVEYINCIKKRLLIFTTPVYVQNSPAKWGSIQIGLSMESTQRAILNMKLILFSIGLPLIIIGSIWIKFLTQKITSPVESLIEATKQAARGNLDHQISINVKNELKVLVDSFNQMIQEIKKSRYRLQEWGQDLEKKVEERTHELKQSEAKYRSLIENSLSGIFILQNDKIIFANHRLEQITGYSISNLKALPSVFDIIIPEERKTIQEKFSNRNGKQSQKCEFRIKTNDNKTIWIETNSSHIIFNDEPALQISAHDITEKRRIEERLLHAQKMESIGTLASGIAHDFNNLLGGILGLSSNLMEIMPEKGPYYDDVEYIAKVAKQGADLTAQLLTFSKKGNFERNRIDVNYLISDVVNLLSHTIDRAISIETKFESEILEIKADGSQIQQAILNICLNARDAMPAGGLLTIETKKTYIDNTMSVQFAGISNGHYICISISDTGIGMDNETQKRIFEPFFSTKEKKQGTGLGLAMVYNIVKNHKGYINVYSEPEKFTNMNVYLPAVSPEDRSEVEICDIKDDFIKKYLQPQKIHDNSKILLVDDEPVIRNVAEKILVDAGYTVMVANDGLEAVNLYRNNPKQIGLVILDLIMPNQGGIETYFILRQIDDDVKVLISSGYSKDGNIQELLNSGAQGYIQKPFFARELVRIIREILEEKEVMTA
jgi:PAS domain S-box-containing protein